MKFHLTPRSANAKTGPMAVSTSSRATCSPSCPFAPENGGGCYAASGPLNLHWLKVTAGERGTDLAGFLAAVRKLPRGSAFRHNQAGDLVPESTDRAAISRSFVASLAKAARHLKAYTYTHHRIDHGENAAILRDACRDGLTVNVSCETEAAADAAVAAGLPAVLVVPADESRKAWTTAGGSRVVVCPAQQSGRTCAECMLCSVHDPGRRAVVAFRVHGSGHKKATAALGAA